MPLEPDQLLLREAAFRALRERGFLPGFPFDALAEANALREESPGAPVQPVQDLRHLPWLSIDDQGARTLDQLTTAEARGDAIRLFVAVADVDAFVPSDSALDRHARHNTRSIYTPGGTFPMLPEAVAAGLTSLRQGKDRLAVVMEMTVEEDGSISSPEIRRARVRNQAQLTYQRVADWLETDSSLPKTAIKRLLLRKQLTLQVKAARRLRQHRLDRGGILVDRWARSETVEGKIARELIEDLMVAANEAAAGFLRSLGRPFLSRVVRGPDPLGPGEYLVDQAGQPGRPAPRHILHATDAYVHATAPNRRYADLITQRLIKAGLSGSPSPYPEPEQGELALLCTRREGDASAVLDILSASCAVST